MSTTLVSGTVTASGTAAAAPGWTFVACTAAAGGVAPVGALVAVTDMQFTQGEFGAPSYGLGRTLPVVISDVIGGNDGQVTVETFEDTTYKILSGLLRSQATIWMANPFGEGWYVRAGFAGGSGASPSSPSTNPAAIRVGGFQANTGAARVRSLTIVYIEQARP